MKIVNTDNFNGDYPNESFVTGLAWGMNAAQAKRIADAINAEFCGPTMPRYWKVVPDDYVLSPGFEP